MLLTPPEFLERRVGVGEEDGDEDDAAYPQHRDQEGSLKALEIMVLV